MASPILAATIQARLVVRYSVKKMVDLTNQDNCSATALNVACLNAAIEDAELLHQSLVGAKSDDKYAHDIGAIQMLTMYYLFKYAGAPELSDEYITDAQIFLEESLSHRLNVLPSMPVDQRPQEFTLRQQMIQSLPTRGGF